MGKPPNEMGNCPFASPLVTPLHTHALSFLSLSLSLFHFASLVMYIYIYNRFETLKQILYITNVFEYYTVKKKVFYGTPQKGSVGVKKLPNASKG